jgi:phosphohistidine phosphatase
MKQLLLVRHAKSSWDDMSISDFERPLNVRGKQDAPAMAQRLLDQKVAIDAFYSSPARRAKRTATIFAKTYKKGKDDILFIPELYGAPEEVFYEVISNADDRFQSIAIFSHNPGITDFANELTDIKIDNIPTCGVFSVKIDCKQWMDFKKAEKVFLFFKYPKGGE